MTSPFDVCGCCAAWPRTRIAAKILCVSVHPAAVSLSLPIFLFFLKKKFWQNFPVCWRGRRCSRLWYGDPYRSIRSSKILICNALNVFFCDRVNPVELSVDQVRIVVEDRKLG